MQESRKYTLVDDVGNLRFTQAGLNKYGAHFLKAGVDITKVKHINDYRKAIELSAPFFSETMLERVEDYSKNITSSLEADLLISIFDRSHGNPDDLMNKIELKKSLKIV